MGAVMAVCATAGGACLALPSMLFSSLCCCLTGLSCVCSFANFFACCCQGAMGNKTGVSPRNAKLLYVLVLTLCMILALLLRFNSYGWDLGELSLSCASTVLVGNEYYTALNSTVYCKGDAAVFRISFILVTFFGLMMVLSIFSEAAHRGFWFIKLVLVFGGIAGSMFMGPENFDSTSFAWFARFASFFFLVLQIMIIIDFAYQWNESWVAKAYANVEGEFAPPSNKKWLVFVLLSALVLYLLCCVGGLVVLYIFYSSCSIGMGMTVWTTVAIVIMTIVSLFREQLVGVPGAILPVAVVSAYAVFLCWGALESNADVTCRPTGSSQSVWTIVLGCLWAMVTLLWATYSVTGNAAHLVKAEPLEPPPDTGGDVGDAEKGAPVQQTMNGGPVVGGQNNVVSPEAGGDDEKEIVVYSTERVWPFHFILMCGSAYMAMLLTDWGTLIPDGQASLAGNSSMWVKISAQWITIALFTWTLVAPGVLKNRDFS